jgi:hypothetical protein
MEKLKVPFCAVAFVGLLSPFMSAANVNLYDFAVSSSTGIKADWQDVSATDPTTLAGMSSTMVCCGDTGGSTPGIGALKYTFTGAPGSYTVTMYFDYDVSTPNFNEYGKINNAGSVPGGISYQIFNANSTTGNIVLYGATGVAGGETLGTANNTNGAPGTTDNFLGTCTAAGCNVDVGMALTYTFTLGANEEAILSANSFLTDQGGFSLQTIHPVDANNTTASSVFLNGSLLVQPTSMSTKPEPATWALMGAALTVFGLARARRKSRIG